MDAEHLPDTSIQCEHNVCSTSKTSTLEEEREIHSARCRQVLIDLKIVEAANDLLAERTENRTSPELSGSLYTPNSSLHTESDTDDISTATEPPITVKRTATMSSNSIPQLVTGELPDAQYVSMYQHLQ